MIQAFLAPLQLSPYQLLLWHHNHAFTLGPLTTSNKWLLNTRTQKEHKLLGDDYMEKSEPLWHRDLLCPTFHFQTFLLWHDLVWCPNFWHFKRFTGGRGFYMVFGWNLEDVFLCDCITIFNLASLSNSFVTWLVFI